ncbi:hypothetical protein V2J09_021570 [Rumex salicifolius]
MTTSILSSNLQARFKSERENDSGKYLECCKWHNVLPNSEAVLWLSKADLQKSETKRCTVVIVLDQLRDADFAPLFDLILEAKHSEIDAVDILLETHCTLDEKQIMSLIQAADQKINTVQILGLSSNGDLPRILFQEGSDCQVLRLSLPRLQKLENLGTFMKLKTLNLDFCTSLKLLHKDCFNLMPHLMHLSMCDTRVSDLWTATTALSKLDSLVELRFQNCLCCTDTGSCPAFSTGNKFQTSNPKEKEAKDIGLKQTAVRPTKYTSSHPSPICFEKHYRAFMIVSLPELKVLDNLPIDDTERKRSAIEFSKYYEYLPYGRKQRESILSVLHSRETNCRSVHKPSSQRKIPNKHHFSRSISAAKLASSPCPLFNSISKISCIWKDDVKKLRPRQFEYHPSDSRLMAFGTLDGEVVVINHESGKVVDYMPSLEARDRILGLCWLNKSPSKVLAGSDSGSLKLFNINQSRAKTDDPFSSSAYVKFDSFTQLTSVHVNSTDERFLASGYSKNLALYDIDSGKRLQVFTDVHREPINVAKFSHHSPFLFATSSFDHQVKMWDLRQNMSKPCYTATSLRGNVMVCFSPDDLYLLVSAVDNEVKQLLAVDGRLHTDFGIASTGSSHNYTRSYYMNGRDYIVSGSSDEKVVRICCAQTGKRLRDVYLEGRGTGQAIFVQSLRSDPFRQFNMSILAAYSPSSSRCEIVKVNLHSSGDPIHESSGSGQLRPPSSLGDICMVNSLLLAFVEVLSVKERFFFCTRKK